MAALQEQNVLPNVVLDRRRDASFARRDAPEATRICARRRHRVLEALRHQLPRALLVYSHHQTAWTFDGLREERGTSGTACRWTRTLNAARLDGEAHPLHPEAQLSHQVENRIT